jgi:hypothetical protein
MKVTKHGLELTNDLVNDLVMVKDIKYRNGNLAVGRVISYCVPVSPINTYGQVNYPALKARGLQEAHDPYHEHFPHSAH